MQVWWHPYAINCLSNKNILNNDIIYESYFGKALTQPQFLDIKKDAMPRLGTDSCSCNVGAKTEKNFYSMTPSERTRDLIKDML